MYLLHGGVHDDGSALTSSASATATASGAVAVEAAAATVVVLPEVSK